MTDTKLLGECIERSGKKKNFLARNIGVTPTTFRFKCRGEYQFTQNEIAYLIKALDLTADERQRIFFADKVDDLSTAM